MSDKIEICPDCGCIITEELDEKSCWCGVKIAAQRELDAINEDTPGWIKLDSEQADTPINKPCKTTLINDLTHLLNYHSEENGSNTPDFILAQYLEGCLRTYERAVQQRQTWHGRDPRPSCVD